MTKKTSHNTIQETDPKPRVETIEIPKDELIVEGNRTQSATPIDEQTRKVGPIGSKTTPELFNEVEDVSAVEDQMIPQQKNLVDPEKELKNTIYAKQEDTRGRIATIFLIGFFFLLVGGIALSLVVDGEKLKQTTEIILAISGILSGPLGFIVGYYFKQEEERMRREN